MFGPLDKEIDKFSAEEITSEFAALIPEDAVNEEEKKRIADGVENIVAKKVSDLKAAKTDVQHGVENTIERLAQTTRDLEKIPYFGKAGLFLRGMQRTIWGFSLLYIDLKVLSGSWQVKEGSITESTFWLINLLILGFLFGERAAKNIMPMINRRIE